MAYKTAAKAFFAGVVTFLGTLVTALASDQSFTQINTKTWLTVALATVIAIGGVYGVTNAPAVVE